MCTRAWQPNAPTTSLSPKGQMHQRPLSAPHAQGFTIRPVADQYDYVASIPFDSLSVDQVVEILLFFVSMLGASCGAISTELLTKWLNNNLREVVDGPVS